MNEANTAAAAPEKTPEDAKLELSLKEFSKLTVLKERREFYISHPELQRVYSPVNFHAA